MKAMTMTKDDFKAVITEVKRMKEEAQKMARQAFSDGSKILFTLYPNLESFSWEQWTPYFNDGDICEFEVNSNMLKINGGDNLEVYSNKCYSYKTGDYVEDRDFVAMTLAVQEFIDAFDTDDLKWILNEGAVTVHRDGRVEVEWVEHY